MDPGHIASNPHHCAGSQDSDYCILTMAKAIEFCKNNECKVVSQTFNGGWNNRFKNSVMISTREGTRKDYWWDSCIRNLLLYFRIST